MDAWCERHTGKKYDHDALMARQGQTDEALLIRLMSDPYVKKDPPKSTGREHYHMEWLDKQLTQTLSAEDVQRTLCEFTALSTAQQIRLFQTESNCELLVCGGGANNSLLIERIQHHLPAWNILPTSDRGIPGDHLEAMAFAWLACQRIHNQPSNLPSVTGAGRQASLGVFYPAVKAFT